MDTSGVFASNPEAKLSGISEEASESELNLMEQSLERSNRQAF
jgi:hypothetical protein